MDDLNRVLGDIRSIRRQVVQTTEFRGFGPWTLCATSAFAIAAGAIQSTFIRAPMAHPLQYVALWSVTAALSLALIAFTTLTRARRMHSVLSSDMIRMAVEQFLPATVAGVLATIIIVRTSPHSVWLLPAMWQIIYSLGVFSSCRFLPRPMLVAGAWYLLTGLACLALGDNRALAVPTMTAAYGVGQLIIAAVLYCCIPEPTDEE